MTTQSKAITFQRLHQSGDPFVMANAWSTGTAILLEDAGVKAVGTTSAGIAFNHGLPDYEGALPFHVALEETRRIVEAVTVPVSMDAENGYGHASQSVFENMKKIVETGVVGASIEDYTGVADSPLYHIDLAVERIRAAKESVSGLDYPFTLTARAECYLTGHASPFDEAVRRVNRYREAGADCLFVPGVKDLETIAALVREVDAPVSVVVGLAGAPLTVTELKDAGVARISVGGSLARATLELARRAAREMLDRGTFTYSEQQIADDDLNRLFSGRNSPQSR